MMACGQVTTDLKPESAYYLSRTQFEKADRLVIVVARGETDVGEVHHSSLRPGARAS
jgi:hypothetical protein